MTPSKTLSNCYLIDWILPMQGRKKLLPVVVMGSMALGLNPSLTMASEPIDQMNGRRFEQFRSIDDMVRFMNGKSIGMDMVQVAGTHGAMDQSVTWREQGMQTASGGYPVHGSSIEAMKNYNITIERVRGLTQLEDEEDAPSPDVLSLAIEFLAQVKTSLYEQFPKGATAVRDDGSVDVYWRQPGRIVQLTVPAQQDHTLSVYHREGDKHGTDTAVSPETLARWLEWFARA